MMRNCRKTERGFAGNQELSKAIKTAKTELNRVTTKTRQARRNMMINTGFEKLMRFRPSFRSKVMPYMTNPERTNNPIMKQSHKRFSMKSIPRVWHCIEWIALDRRTPPREDGALDADYPLHRVTEVTSTKIDKVGDSAMRDTPRGSKYLMGGRGRPLESPRAQSTPPLRRYNYFST